MKTQKMKEKVSQPKEAEWEKRFEKLLIGETFAGGTFNENSNQRMYSEGYKDGVIYAKWNLKSFINQELAATLPNPNELEGFTELILEMLANPDYSCNDQASYNIDPLKAYIKANFLPKSKVIEVVEEIIGEDDEKEVFYKPDRHDVEAEIDNDSRNFLRAEQRKKLLGLEEK